MWHQHPCLRLAGNTQEIRAIPRRVSPIVGFRVRWDARSTTCTSQSRRTASGCKSSLSLECVGAILYYTMGGHTTTVRFCPVDDRRSSAVPPRTSIAVTFQHQTPPMTYSSLPPSISHPLLFCILYDQISTTVVLDSSRYPYRDSRACFRTALVFRVLA